jgi:hypothetical protein
MSKSAFRHSLVLACVLALPVLLASHAVQAAPPVAVPNTFQPNTPAKAAEVNANFAALVNAINAQQATIAALQSQLSSMGNVAALNNVVQLVQVSHTDGDGHTNVYPTVQFHDVNVQIVNGMGSTSTSNGLGNLIIGYNESFSGMPPFCSDGNYNADANTCYGHGVWAADQRTGSHNVIVGYGNSYSQYGGLSVGLLNILNGKSASVLGRYNTASGDFASVTGGNDGTASGYAATLCGGGGGQSASGNYQVACP